MSSPLAINQDATLGATLNDFLGTRYRNVLYQLPEKVLGVSIRQPHGLVPWDGGFGAVQREQHGSGTGRDNKDFLNVYNVAMKGWLSDIFTVAGNSIPVVMAAPKLAFSDYWYSLPEPIKASYLQACSGGGPDRIDPATPPPPNFTNAMYPLPFISFSRVGNPEPRTGSNAVPLRNLGFIDIDRKQTSWSRHPTPYTLTFQIEIWSKYQSMHNWWFSMFDEAFQGQMSYMGVPSFLSDTAEPLMTGIKIKSAVDNSDLEATSDKESIFRWTMTVEVEAWKFYEVRSAPTVHSIEVATQIGTDTIIHHQVWVASAGSIGPVTNPVGIPGPIPGGADDSDSTAYVQLPAFKLGNRWLGITLIGPITKNGVAPPDPLDRVVMTFTKDGTTFTLDSELSNIPDASIVIQSGSLWIVTIPAVDNFLPIIGNWEWDMKFYSAGTFVTLYEGIILVNDI